MFVFKKNCDQPDDVLLFFNIVVGHDACLQLGKLVPASPNIGMANFLSFVIYDIDFLKVMNESNLNFVLLQTTSKSIIVEEDLDRFLTEKSTAVSLFIDIHIHFPLCNFLAFKTLANSYLGLKEYKFFSKVEDIFQSGVSLSSAEISMLMVANRNSSSQAIKSVIIMLQTDGDRRGIGKIGSRLGDNATPNTHLFLKKIIIINNKK
jgi:chaperone BCS1